ncbi:MAG: THAP domain-containing protein [Sphingomonadales bacterium]|nr:THAP domain-containing protein [Sphingomonadales bacterium]
MGKSGNICAVAICPSPQDASYHHFPKDELLRKIWSERCFRKDPINPNTAKICSNHFSTDDFIRDLQAELLGQSRRRQLQKGAVPSKNLKPSNQSDTRQTKAGINTPFSTAF